MPWLPLELPATSTKREQKRATNGERHINRQFCGAHAESADGYWGMPGRKWAERVKISTWLHAEHVEVGAEMNQVAPRWKSCNQSPVMQLLRSEQAYCGSSMGRGAIESAWRHVEAMGAHACNLPLGSRHARGSRGIKVSRLRAQFLHFVGAVLGGWTTYSSGHL